jgi:hypothetical protein
MGDDTKPGDLIYEQDFVPLEDSWNNVVLDNPVYLNGGDIWVGYQYHQPDADLYIAGADGGPAHPLGGFLTFNDVAWVLLTDYAADANWNIRANISGDPIFNWLSLDPASGTVAPAGSQAVTATFDATGLTEGNYSATVRVMSNDPETPTVNVPVIFIVTPGGTTQSVCLDFEDIADWSLTFGDWTAVDVDGSSTYGFSGTEFPNNYEPMAFICFNPELTDPPMTDDPEIQPHSGERFGACMASVPPPTNDDWLISPQIMLGTNSTFNFWVKSYTDDYGLEKYNVGVSTTGMDPDDFTFINDPSPLEAPVVWTEQNFDLSDYDGQTVYVAIQCVSEDAFVFMVDDICVDFMVGAPELPEDEARISIYPNPARDYVRITSSEEMVEVEILNQLGQRVYNQVVKNTNVDISTIEFESGVYYVRIKSDTGSSIQKLVIQ